MKQSPDYQKLRGGYYTPQVVSDFIVEWGLKGSPKTVLEPSCGDGSFLRSLNKKINNEIADEVYVQAVELDPIECEKSRMYGYDVRNMDFFEASDRFVASKSIDFAVGNPPFIRYQNFDEDSRNLAFSQMRDAGFKPSKLTNIWVPFLVLSALSLSEYGRLGMVVPAELLQVNYAKECRDFLFRHFAKVTVISFRKLLFDDAQQEVVLLLAERGVHSDAKVSFVELNSKEDLCEFDVNALGEDEYSSPSRDGKWTRFYLSNAQRRLLDRVASQSGVSRSEDLFETNVGVVSGENRYFVLDSATVKQRHLKKYVTKIVSKSENLKGILFSDDDYTKLSDQGKKVYFLELAEGVKTTGPLGEYIRYGEEMGYSENYKCRIRRQWYCVPTSWKPNGFALRQVNKYPRLVVNRTSATSTDTIHKVRFKEGVIPELVSAAFINSFTFALAETVGRSYGGGVLTFEPSEIRALMIPMENAEKLPFERIDQLLREDRVEEALDITDEILLHQGLGLTTEEIKVLQSAWTDLRDRRLSRRSR